MANRRVANRSSEEPQRAGEVAGLRAGNATPEPVVVTAGGGAPANGQRRVQRKAR